MASHELRITLAWENNESFEMRSRLGEDEDISVIKVEENACIANLWGGITGVCFAYFQEQLRIIGEEMKV